MALSEQELTFIATHQAAAMITVGADGFAKPARVGVGVVDGKLWSSSTADRVRTKRLRRDPRPPCSCTTAAATPGSGSNAS